MFREGGKVGVWLKMGECFMISSLMGVIWWVLGSGSGCRISMWKNSEAELV